jgi:hypothetical protein
MYKWLALYRMYMVEQTAKEYGRYSVRRKRESKGFGSTDVWYVAHTGTGWEVETGTKQNGKKLARTLAAVLDSAGVMRPADVMPPEWGARGITSGDDEWQEWAAENKSVPAKVATAGNAAVAGWLKVVGKEREGWIATELGVSEQTVRQYLSDLREGRR